MSGRYLTWICWLFNHPEPLWAVTPKGVGFRCPGCQRVRVSPVLEALR